MNVLAIDVGGTKTLIGMVTPSGEVVHRAQYPTRIGTDDIGRVSALIVDELTTISKLGKLGNQVGAMCVGFPEYVSQDGLLTSCEVLTWAEQPRPLIARAMAGRGLAPVPIGIDSDVRLGALGEAVFGAAAGCDSFRASFRDSLSASFMYISLGTGLSSTFVVAGVPWAGQRGEAIALGEWPGPEGVTLEQYASGAAIARRYAGITGVTRTTREIVSLSADDPIARTILESAGSALGRACADIASLLDPAAIVLGGGLGSASTPLSEAAHRAYLSATARRPHSPPWQRAHLGANSGLFGAAAAALRLLSQDP